MPPAVNACVDLLCVEDTCTALKLAFGREFACVVAPNGAVTLQPV